MKMRLGSIITACLIMMVLMSSCVREYTCQCQIIYSGQALLPDTTINEYPVTDNVKNARADCQAQSTTTEKDGVKTEENCDLF
jgi:hypothetical protein